MKTCCAILCVLFVVVVCNINTSNGQLPPRQLSIPGAVLLTQAKPSGFRQARIHSDSSPPRPRRPSLPPNALPLPVREVRPVIEESEEPSQPSAFDDEVTKLGISALSSAVRQAASEDGDEPIGKSPLPFRPERPIPVLRQDVRERSEQNIPLPRPQPVQRQELPQNRPPPIQRQERPRFEDQPVRQPQPSRGNQGRQQAIQQQAPPVVRQQAQARPVQRQHHYDDNDNSRTRRPIVQILRKYRTDNPDGSITWGYENEDGTFKEETLGIDCVTKGKYGYVDPDGVRREYNYETGNKCDSPEEDQELLLEGKQFVPQPRKPQPAFRPQPGGQY